MNNAESVNAQALFEAVHSWARDRDLIREENKRDQMLKVHEEIGELNAALTREDMEAVVDGIGDGFVTLIILSHQVGYSPEYCLLKAYQEIKDREGETKNGLFIKKEDIE